MSIGSRIKNTRKNTNLTQEQIADSLNISYQTASPWERDLAVLDVYNLIDLAKLFDVYVSYLIEEKPDFETDSYICPLLDVIKNTKHDNAKWLLS